jgi:cell division protein ZapA (FtsZ GTPase activity inhibitor)
MVNLNTEQQVKNGRLIMSQHSLKILPIYLQPRILSAVSYIHKSLNQEIALERINRVSRKLSERELLYVMSLLVFDNLLDMVNFYYGKNNFCSLNCQNDWINKHIEQALNHFGRVTEPIKVMANSAWYKDYKYNYDHVNNRSNNSHYFANDLLGQRVPITEQQYNDKNITTPNNLSQ